MSRLRRDERGFTLIEVMLAATIMLRPVWFFVGATALLLALAAPVLDINLGPGSNAGIPKNLEAVKGNDVLTAAVAVARQEGLDGGYRELTNTGPDAGQTVHHLHVHVMGGPRPWLKG